MKNIEIVFENDNCLVINKPSGLAVHEGGNIVDPTLSDWLKEKYPSIIDVGDDKTRPGIVHRLDMQVSGLMVIAKNQESFNNLKNQFKNREIIKEYTALVHGVIDKEFDIINFPIKRSKDGYKMAAIPKNTEDLLTRKQPKSRDKGNIDAYFKAKEAITKFEVIKRYVNFTLLKVKIETGRTHQIRVHLFSYGHPVLGDPLYYTKKTKTKNEKFNLDRIFLFSDRLSFKDTDNSVLNFGLDMPEELKIRLPKN